jgi:hypothetical protein
VRATLDTNVDSSMFASVHINSLEPRSRGSCIRGNAVASQGDSMEDPDSPQDRAFLSRCQNR